MICNASRKIIKKRGYVMIRLSAFADEAGKELSCQIEALKRNGISMIELRSVGKKNVKDLTLDEAKEISAELKSNGITLSALGSPMGKVKISVDIDEYLNEVRHMCELAVALETDKIRMFSFFEAYEERDKVIDTLKKMVAIADGYGIKLCHENEKKIYGDTTERVLDLKENVEGLYFVYDFANYLQVDEKPSENLAVLYPITEYFHIKDVVYSTGELVPAGEGDGEIDKLIRMLDRDAILTIEPHLKVFDGYAEIDGETMKHRFHFESNGEAFDAAVAAIKGLILANGYKEIEGGFERI